MSLAYLVISVMWKIFGMSGVVMKKNVHIRQKGARRNDIRTCRNPFPCPYIGKTKLVKNAIAIMMIIGMKVKDRQKARNNMVVFCTVIFIVEAIGLLMMIIDQKKFEKECREPAVDMRERIFAYLVCIVFPTIVGLLMRK